MEYIKKPSMTVQTPFGPMVAHFISGTRIVFSQTHEQFLIIKRKNYKAHFAASFNGEAWKLTLGISHGGFYQAADYSQESAYGQAHAGLSAWLTKWVADQTLILADAERLDAKGTAAEAVMEVARAEEALRVAKEKLKAAKSRYDIV